ncbi:hypothetical protein K7432_009088 [Basidiobolus ranarum]|uniref:Alcohol dehydrogenase-like C-terminal domain-containing protein n=1 Tax=Basidiobolus ranarum TaxID=34480 RepID=A0ABR2VYG2_9FUNG
MNNIHPGDIYGVVGIGGLSYLAIQYAKKFGYITVARSSSTNKKELASELGANIYIDQSSQDVVQELKKLGGAELIIVTAAGGELSEVIDRLAFDGTLLIVAMLPEPLKVDTVSLILKRAQIRRWPSGTQADAEDALNSSALSNTKPLILTYTLKQAKQTCEDMMSESQDSVQ